MSEREATHSVAFSKRGRIKTLCNLVNLFFFSVVEKPQRKSDLKRNFPKHHIVTKPDEKLIIIVWGTLTYTP